MNERREHHVLPFRDVWELMLYVDGLPVAQHFKHTKEEAEKYLDKAWREYDKEKARGS